MPSLVRSRSSYGDQAKNQATPTPDISNWAADKEIITARLARSLIRRCRNHASPQYLGLARCWPRALGTRDDLVSSWLITHR